MIVAMPAPNAGARATCAAKNPSSAADKRHTWFPWLQPHPVSARQGWVCIVRPGPQTVDEMRTLLNNAHRAAKRRWTNRHD